MLKGFVDTFFLSSLVVTALSIIPISIIVKVDDPRRRYIRSLFSLLFITIIPIVTTTLLFLNGSNFSFGEGFGKNYISNFLFYFWVTGATFMGIKDILSYLYLKIKIDRSLYLPTTRVRDSFQKVLSYVDITKGVEIFISEKIDSPITYGFFKPVVLFPVSVITGMDIKQVESLMVHELIHIKRNDYLVNILQNIIEVFNFFNPMVYILNRVIRESREMICDDTTLSYFNGERDIYLKAIGEVAVKSRSSRFALASSGGSVINRLRRVKEGRTDLFFKVPKLSILFALILTICSIFLKDISFNEKGDSDLNLTHSIDSSREVPQVTTMRSTFSFVLHTDDNPVEEDRKIRSAQFVEGEHIFSFSYTFKSPKRSKKVIIMI